MCPLWPRPHHRAFSPTSSWDLLRDEIGKLRSALAVCGERARAGKDLGSRLDEGELQFVVMDYTRAFFDRYLKGMRSPLLDAKVPNVFVESVERFGRGKRSR